MLNQVPDKRDPIEVDGQMYYGTRRFTEADSEIELGEHEDSIPHEAIDLGERRKSSASSSKSGSASPVPDLAQRQSTVAAGKSKLLFSQQPSNEHRRIP